MRRAETKTRYKISSTQAKILGSLLKYRFLTSDLLAALMKKDRSTMYERLAVLVDQGYVAKKYDSTYRIDRRPASYYLAPAGIRYLKSLGMERTQIHYKNKDFTESQIEEYYRYPRLSMAIHQSYPETFRTVSKYQLDPEDHIKPMPWLMLQPDNENTPEFYLEYFRPGELSWVMKKRINQHIEYGDGSEYTYPYLLLVAGNDNTEKRIVQLCTYILWDSEVYTTTEERLMSGEKNIWLRPHEVEDWDDELEFHPLPMEFEE